MPKQRPMRALSAIALSLICAWGSAHAQSGSLEERFKAFFDGLRSRGQAVLPGLGGAPEVKTATVAPRTDTLPIGKDQAAVFVANGCVSCNGLAEKLTRQLGSVSVLNISTSQTAREAFAATGAKGVPAIVFGKRLVTGYDPKLMERVIVEDMQDRARETAKEGGA